MSHLEDESGGEESLGCELKDSGVREEREEVVTSYNSVSAVMM